MAYLWVAAGGALGAMARYGVVTLTSRFIEHSFFYGTLIANLLGSFAIGMLYVWLVEQQLGSSWYRPLMMVGFLGAFTTFSTFSLDSLLLIEQGRFGTFALYAGVSVGGCLLATLAGMWLSKSVI